MNNFEDVKSAYANGEQIQYSNANSGGAWGAWIDYDRGKNMASPMPIDNHGGYRKWRIKPMNILEKTKEIIKKHNLTEKLTFNPFKVRRESKSGGCGWAGDGVLGFSDSPEFKDSYLKATNLQNKYKNKIGESWYGFDIDCWPVNWINALEEFLAELEKDSPDFEIHQIKLKYGTARIYIDNVSKEAYDSIDLLEEVMQDENLIY